MRSMLCPPWEARPGFQNKGVKERVHSWLSTADAYRKNNPPQCSTKLQCRSGWKEKSPEEISTPEIFHSGGKLSPSRTAGALLYCQLCYSTQTLLLHLGMEQSDCARGILLLTPCYYNTALLQPLVPFLTIITLRVKENPFNRESVLFNRKGWFYTKYCGEV